MSHQNHNKTNGEVILPLQHFEDLKNLSDELLQHEINFCLSAIDRYPNKYTENMKKRLFAAETEAERRFLLDK